MIRLLFFAHLGEQVGERQVTWPHVPETVGKLKEEVEARYSLSLERVMTAVNEEYAHDDAPLQTGDTVAFIPPVSGGESDGEQKQMGDAKATWRLGDAHHPVLARRLRRWGFVDSRAVVYCLACALFGDIPAVDGSQNETKRAVRTRCHPLWRHRGAGACRFPLATAVPCFLRIGDDPVFPSKHLL